MRKLPLKNGTPKYIRCYDNGGKTLDRFTVVFTGRRAENMYLGMSENPFHGFGQHGQGVIDRPSYKHLGKKIPFSALTDDCKRLVMQDYADIWDFPVPPTEINQII